MSILGSVPSKLAPLWMRRLKRGDSGGRPHDCRTAGGHQENGCSGSISPVQVMEKRSVKMPKPCRGSPMSAVHRGAATWPIAGRLTQQPLRGNQSEPVMQRPPAAVAAQLPSGGLGVSFLGARYGPPRAACRTLASWELPMCRIGALITYSQTSSSG